jgi:hypothetical protein
MGTEYTVLQVLCAGPSFAVPKMPKMPKRLPGSRAPPNGRAKTKCGEQVLILWTPGSKLHPKDRGSISGELRAQDGSEG